MGEPKELTPAPTAELAPAKKPRTPRGHASKAELEKRYVTIYEWIVQAKSTPWKYAEAAKMWDILPRQYRKLENVVYQEMRRRRAVDRTFDTEVAVERLDALIAEAWQKGDREEARRATYTRWRITSMPLAGSEPPPAPPAGPTTQVNIGSLVIDMRGMSPIEKQRRLAQLEERRARLLRPARPQQSIDPTRDDEAEVADDDPAER